MAVKLKKIEQSFEDHENTLSRTKKLFPKIEEIAKIWGEFLQVEV